MSQDLFSLCVHDYGWHIHGIRKDYREYNEIFKKADSIHLELYAEVNLPLPFYPILRLHI